MNDKYLPIGTVCTLKGKNKKVMITGFYSVEFSGNLKIKDYSGCVYPEGLLLPEQTCSFNHTDIESVEFKGYIGEEQLVFERRLKGLTGEDAELAAAEFHKGNDMVLASNKSYSKLLFDENGVVMIAEEAKTPIEKEEIKNTKLEIENPFHKEYDSSKDSSSNTSSNDWKIFNNNLAFDENGVVVADLSDLEEKKKNLLNDIKFDENGVVIAVNTVDEVTSNVKSSNIKFDENGVVIAEGEEEIPPIGPGLPGYVEPKQGSNIKFDENGVVVAEGEEEIPPIGPGLPGYVGSSKEEENLEEVPPIGPGLPGYVEPKQDSNIKFDENGVVIAE